jgi:hypothetical protein
MRVIDREQAKLVGGFHSLRRVNRRLLALTRAGLLKRFFMGTVAGGKRALYSLSPLSAKLVQVPCRGPRRRKDEAVTVDFFVHHQLCINEIYCVLKYQTIPLSTIQLGCWKNFTSPIDAKRSLKPDGYFEIHSGQDTLASSFLEMDLGHENLVVWRTKVQKYLDYAVSGDFERTFHQRQFRVLVVTDSERRREVLRRATLSVTEKIFWFSTIDSIHRNGFWSRTWFRSRVDCGPISFP